MYKDCLNMTKELECTTESGNCMGEKEYWCKQLNKEEVMHVSRLKRWYVYTLQIRLTIGSEQ